MNDAEKIQWIHDCLEDEESKYIFENRQNYSESGNEKYIENIVNTYVAGCTDNVYYAGKEELLYDKLKKYDKKIILWGYGFKGKKIFEECKRNDIEISYIIDSDRKKQGVLEAGIQIVSLETIVKKENPDNCVFVITSMYCVDEIRAELMKYQCKQIEVVNNYSTCFLKNQYFEEGLISFDDGEIFIDGGCFDLETTVRFIERLAKEGKTYQRIHAFEPDIINYEKCKKRIEEKGYRNIDIVNAGLWNQETYVRMENAGTAGAYIVEAGEEGKDGHAVSLDSYIKEEVTFIKLDIEGAELKALEGAQKIISAYKPKLAICLYHKKKDYWQIPYYIKKLVPEYKLYMRHYSNYSAETVLYAI